MTKYITNILIAIALFGCGLKEKNSDNQRIQLDSNSSYKEIEADLKPINLPEGYRLDTIQTIDTARNLAIFISIPISGINQIDKFVSEEIEKQIEKDKISFNFDDYEIACYAEGIIQGRLHKKKLYEKIRTTYR